jgi:hypothetical protein
MSFMIGTIEALHTWAKERFMESFPIWRARWIPSTPKVTAQHFFGNGMERLETIVGSWRRRLATGCLS